VICSTWGAGQGTPVTVTVLVALPVCLIPTTIGALLPAIGIAGMDRMIQKNVIAMSGRAVEAAGDVDVLLPDRPSATSPFPYNAGAPVTGGSPRLAPARCAYRLARLTAHASSSCSSSTSVNGGRDGINRTVILVAAHSHQSC
jgi:hypothetical protein